jgi:hypothetical protein
VKLSYRVSVGLPVRRLPCRTKVAYIAEYGRGTALISQLLPGMSKTRSRDGKMLAREWLQRLQVFGRVNMAVTGGNPSVDREGLQ